MIHLGVNIDHVATIRQARGIQEPNPLEAAFICEKAGAHSITVHLREDRRHIQDDDVLAVKKHCSLPLNLEMALNEDIMKFALEVNPRSVTLVPEKREELTTEGGLNIIKYQNEIKQFNQECKERNIALSLFIDPVEEQVLASAECEVPFIELHTGEYANAVQPKDIESTLDALYSAANLATEQGIIVNAGHGLNYQNVTALVDLPGLYEFNIGHSIVARAVMVGMERAVRDMLTLLEDN